ncbi:MAG: V-type ATPase subunit [Acidobacteria bacterium]|nr:V-type ATPase subunit [Acidobacteriota bacterium]
MAEGCDYANARVRAMRSRLLGRAGIAALLAEPGLAARLEFLKRTDYGEAVTAHLGGESDQLAATERGLRARLMDDLAQIDRFLAGTRVRALFRSILAFEDGWTIKTILRGVAAGEAPERMFLLLAPTPVLDHAALEQLVRQREVKTVVDLLATWRSPYARALVEGLAAYAQRRDLLYFEVPLDRVLFGRALDAARRDGEDGRMLLAFLEAQVDLVNAATLLKIAGHGGADEFFIAGGRVIGPRRYRQYARLDAASLKAALAREGRLLAAAGLVTLAALDDPVATDQLLQRALGEAMRREALRNPLSLAVPLSFVLERRAEIERIRLVLRGAEFGLPAAELLELVEP